MESRFLILNIFAEEEVFLLLVKTGVDFVADGGGVALVKPNILILIMTSNKYMKYILIKDKNTMKMRKCENAKMRKCENAMKNNFL
jgi:hypothetical protein